MDEIIPNIYVGVYLNSVTQNCTQLDKLNRLKKLILDIGTSIYPMTWETLGGKFRKKELVLMRQLFCYFCKEWSILPTLTSIGNEINRDHTTVIHSIQQIKDLIDSKDELTLQIYNFILNHKNR
jgi:chromosomal replication initiator protein